MRILVLGAAGKLGRQIVHQATNRGHKVTVLEQIGARSWGKEVKALAGDPLRAETLRRALAGQEAVICLLGWPEEWPPDLCVRALAILIEQMRALGVRRLIAIKGLGTRGSPCPSPLILRWLRSWRFLHRRLADQNQQQRLIRASGLDWTIIRSLTGLAGRGYADLPRPTDAALGGRVYSVARRDIPAFVLAELDTVPQVSHLAGWG